MVLKKASVAEYNEAVARLHGLAEARRKEREIAEMARELAEREKEKQEAVRRANDAVSMALKQLATDVNNLKISGAFDETYAAIRQYLEQMRVELTRIRQRASEPVSCNELAQLGSQVASMHSMLAGIRSERAGADSIAAGVRTEMRAVENDIQKLESGWKRLQAAAQGNDSGVTRPVYTIDDIQSAVQAANEKLQAVSSTLSKELAKIDELVKQGDALVQEAEGVVGKLNCRVRS